MIIEFWFFAAKIKWTVFVRSTVYRKSLGVLD